jgi:hypothetical protein
MRRRWRCHGGPGERPCAAEGGRGRAGDVLVLSVPWQRSSSWALATALARAGGHVYGVADVEEIVQVQGEREGRTTVPRRGQVLARPGPCRCTLWRAWVR